MIPLLNVAVYETWVISSKLMKKPGSMAYMLQRLGWLLAAKYWLWLWVKVICTKLAIQGIVHCSSVAWSSRWEFNLIVLTETLVYQKIVTNRQISKWAFEISWWIVGIWAWHNEYFSYSKQISKAHVVQTFNPTLLVEVEKTMWLSYISNP